MADTPRKPDPARIDERFRTEVARKAARKRKASTEKDRSVWFSLGLFGLVGWSIALPSLLGVALGVWLDAHSHGRVSWTLTLLFIGVVAGCFNAWRWVKQELKKD